MSEVISVTDEAMFKQKPESKLTNYLSDLLLEEGIKYCKGQDYTFLDAPLEFKNVNDKRVLVNQVGWGGMVLGKIDFIFDRTKKENPVIFAQNIASSL